MKIRQLCLSVFLAANGLILSSGLAQALTWNFDYSGLGEIGTGSLSYNGSGDGTFNLTSLNITDGSKTWSYVANPLFPDQSATLANQQITISGGAVTNWQFAGENPLQSGFDFGRYFTKDFDYSGNGTGVESNDVYVAYNSSMTPQSQPPESSFQTLWDGEPNASIQFSPAATAAVPWEFSPESGLGLGLPLFFGLRILKKKMSSKFGKKQANSLIS